LYKQTNKHPMPAQKESRVIALLILNLDGRWGS